MGQFFALAFWLCLPFCFLFNILFTSNINLKAKPSLEVQSKGKSSEAKAAQHQLDLETLCSRFSRFSSTTVILYLQNVVRIISRRSYDPLPVS